MIDLNMKAENVETVTVAADGGTMAIKVTVGAETHHLYVDGRINTKTRGEIYPDYPARSMMLDPGSELVKTIKARMLNSKA
jgi:hypothetical protein